MEFESSTEQDVTRWGYVGKADDSDTDENYAKVRLSLSLCVCVVCVCVSQSHPLSLSLSLSLSPCTSAQHECISLLEAAKQAKAAVSEAQDLVATRKDQLESAKGDIQDVLPAIENAYADADQQVCCACSLSLSLCIPFFFLLLTSNPFFLSSQLHLRFAELRSKLDQREQQLRLQLSETKEFKLQYVPTPLPLFCTMHLATRLSPSLSLSLSLSLLLISLTYTHSLSLPCVLQEIDQTD
eukprot:TRINITY_DN734_c0_g1_i19.p1 TRINITY_DN734_c0_g1~~TRINITY_DN734_c0_g1_i19.p1  ORF type:complete len:240 (-),score=62.81 TRINITY_DN734_c0_g1_i19:148-867(-)